MAFVFNIQICFQPHPGSIDLRKTKKLNQRISVLCNAYWQGFFTQFMYREQDVSSYPPKKDNSGARSIDDDIPCQPYFNIKQA